MTETQSLRLDLLGLSKAERNISELILSGLSNAAIAEKVFVSDKTVKFHITAIYRKAQVRSRAEFICLIKDDIVSLPTLPAGAAGGGIQTRHESLKNELVSAAAHLEELLGRVENMKKLLQ